MGNESTDMQTIINQWGTVVPTLLFYGQKYNFLSVFLGKTYVSPCDSQRLHSSMNLGVKWDLCVLFVQTAVKCQDCKFV